MYCIYFSATISRQQKSLSTVAHPSQLPERLVSNPRTVAERRDNSRILQGLNFGHNDDIFNRGAQWQSTSAEPTKKTSVNGSKKLADGILNELFDSDSGEELRSISLFSHVRHFPSQRTTYRCIRLEPQSANTSSAAPRLPFLIAMTTIWTWKTGMSVVRGSQGEYYLKLGPIYGFTADSSVLDVPNTCINFFIL